MCPGCLTQVETGETPSESFLQSESPFDLEAPSTSPLASSSQLPASKGKRSKIASGGRRKQWEQANKDREEFMKRFQSSPFRQGKDSTSPSGSRNSNSDNQISGSDGSEQNESSDESPFVTRKSAPSNRSQSSSSSRNDDVDDDNPLARRKPKNRNPLAGNNTESVDSEDNPFAGGAKSSSKMAGSEKDGNTVPFRPIPELNNPFQPKDSSSAAPVETIGRVRLLPSNKSDISKRFLSGGTSVSIFNSRGIPGFSRKFKLTSAVGKETNSGQVFVSDKPMTGLIFFRSGRLSYLVPMKSREKRTLDAVMSLDGEGLHGLNVGIVDGKIVGVQGIFCDVELRKLVPASTRQGEWIGVEPSAEDIVSIDGAGKRVHGVIVFTGGFDLQGLRLITGSR